MSDDIDEMWSVLYSEQVKFATEKFGEDVKLNLGWGSSDDGAASKIYGYGIMESELSNPTNIQYTPFN